MKYSLVFLTFYTLLNPCFGQSEEFKQKMNAFAVDHDVNYEKKYLNIAQREIGDIDNTDYDWKESYMLKSKEKAENNIGNTAYQKFYFYFYTYAEHLDRQYALKYWLENFINNQVVKPGRMIKEIPYASPTIVLINDTEIIICTYKCSDFSYDNYKYWKKALIKYFGEDNTIAIEVECNGPLKWTKNAPDPKDRRKMF